MGFMESMISTLAQIKRGGASNLVALLLFFKCISMYLLLPELDSDDAVPPLLTAVAKCAPVLCLLLPVMEHHRTVDYDNGWYARRVGAGLVLSAVGDALLVWPHLLVEGMAAFAAAHVAYLAAFGWRPLRPVLGAAYGAAAAGYNALLAPPAGLRALVPLYSALLAAMAWRGGARGGTAALGAAFFLLSDALLGYSLFVGPVPYHQVLVMCTYYVAQLGIALSVQSTRAPHLPQGTQSMHSPIKS